MEDFNRLCDRMVEVQQISRFYSCKLSVKLYLVLADVQTLITVIQRQKIIAIVINIMIIVIIVIIITIISNN